MHSVEYSPRMASAHPSIRGTCLLKMNRWNRIDSSVTIVPRSASFQRGVEERNSRCSRESIFLSRFTPMEQTLKIFDDKLLVYSIKFDITKIKCKSDYENIYCIRTICILASFESSSQERCVTIQKNVKLDSFVKNYTSSV